MMARTQIVANRQETMKYLLRVMCVYSNKEMLIIMYNMGNHWILLSISTTHDQVRYCDLNRLIDPDTGERRTRVYIDVMSTLEE
jgi:hypothetical protein